MNKGLKVIVHKSRDSFCGGVDGGDNRSSRDIGCVAFVYFREDVKMGGAGVRRGEDRDILAGEVLIWASLLKEGENFFLEFLSRVLGD